MHLLLPLFVCIAALYTAGVVATQETREDRGPHYGRDWVLFRDDYNLLHYVSVRNDDSSATTVPEARKVHFQLYTRKNPTDYEEIYPDVEPSNYQGERPLRMVAHGWLSSGDAAVAVDTRDAYLNRSDVNVVVVDWHELADEPSYFAAAYFTQRVGRKVGEMAASLMNRYSFDGSGVNLVGHSLGAHVMGYAGRWLRDHNLTVARITGLDPARPLFEYPTTEGLNSSDASFVQVIHTNAGILGEAAPRGHADFYPNGGGPHQPGCDSKTEFFDACAHGRSYQFFAESILYGGFISRECEDYSSYESGKCDDRATNHMGEDCTTQPTGIFYLKTNAEPRFSMD